MKHDEATFLKSIQRNQCRSLPNLITKHIFTICVDVGSLPRRHFIDVAELSETNTSQTQTVPVPAGAVTHGCCPDTPAQK